MSRFTRSSLRRRLKNWQKKVKQIGLEGRKVCIVMDSNTSHLYGEKVRKVLEPVSAKVISFQFPAGELHKTLDVVRDIL